jgi:hypothetical protein
MVACRWRMERLRLIETALMDSEMNRDLPEAETSEDPAYQMAFAFRRLVDESRSISLASRYESRLHRIHEHSHRTLRELQQTRTSAEAPDPEKSPNEPTPPTAIDPQPIAVVEPSAFKPDSLQPISVQPTSLQPIIKPRSLQPIGLQPSSPQNSSFPKSSPQPWGGRSCRPPSSITA